ncbi:MAG: hypothetical protein ACM3MF_08740 [Anaerolineae bacterium]|jgi:hypothetical protein
MSTELQAALIAGVVALVTAGLTGYLTWRRIAQDRARWLYDVKTSFSVELYRKRMEEYARLSKILLGLSATRQKQLTVAKAHEIAEELNEWMYGAGGLVAGADTRNAGWALRDRLLRWKAGRLPENITEVRRLLFWSMRRDLDLRTGRSLDTTEDSVLKQLQDEMNRVEGQ